MSKQRPRRRGGARTARKAAGRNFWGNPGALGDDDVELIRVADDPTAMVRSLGRPPLPGAETIAEHYFAAVYERAAGLAGALAAASDLLDTDDSH
jgi:hypothetical protein